MSAVAIDLAARQAIPQPLRQAVVVPGPGALAAGALQAHPGRQAAAPHHAAPVLAEASGVHPEEEGLVVGQHRLHGVKVAHGPP